MPGEGDAGAAPAMEVEPDSSPQQFCLRWNNYQSNLTDCFDRLLQTESLVDVTLACDGRSLKAHKVVLSACSPYFQTLFMDNPCGHPIVIMRDIKYCDLKAVVDFMYRGEINVAQDQITALLKVAETLKIRGLTDVGGEQGLARAAKRAEGGAEADGGGGKMRCRRVSGSRSPSSSPPPPSPAAPGPAAPHSAPPPALAALPLLAEDVDIRPGIAEMIREEERAKLMETSHAWLGASTSSIADSYQYQLQSMWQKCWNTNQSLVHNLRFRERGPLKSWRPETMAEAIFSVLKEGLSLSQAARKYDIPYPTFVLYANRVHNMLGPSADGGADLRPKGRGRPQRILLGVWPDEHIRGVIRAVVFRDHSSPHSHHAHHSHALAHIKEENLPPPPPPGSAPPPPQPPSLPHYPALPDGSGGVNVREYVGGAREERVSPGAAAAAAVAAVAQGLRRQMCNMAAAGVGAQHSRHEFAAAAAVAAAAAHSTAASPLAAAALDSPLCSPAPPLRPSPSPASIYREDMETEMCPPRAPSAPLVARNGREPPRSPHTLPPPSPHVKLEPPPPPRSATAETI